MALSGEGYEGLVITSDNSKVTEYAGGTLIEVYASSNIICDGDLLLPGENIWAHEARGILYFVALVWIFLGVSIIADMFMDAIEHITSKTKKVTKNGKSYTVMVWNGTVANLSLMALGTSAPEILLSLIDVVTTLGQPAGELGAACIVGSAAFNLLVITGICIVSVPYGTFKRIDQFGVFLITATTSLFAYLWMYIVLSVWTPNEVTVEEACITFFCFPLLIFVSWCQDRSWFCGKRKGKGAQKKVRVELLCTPEDIARALKTCDYQAAEHNPGPSEALGVEQELDEDGQPMGPPRKLINSYVSNATSRAHSKKGDALVHDMAQHLLANLQEEKAHFKPGHEGRNRRQYVESGLHHAQHLESEPQADEHKAGDTVNLSVKGVPTLSFEPAAYSVMENAGKVTLQVCRTGDLSRECSCRVTTGEGTAKAGTDQSFVALDTQLNFKAGEHSKKVEVTIIDNDRPNQPDLHFTVQLAGLGDARLGSHPTADVCIVDDDVTGILAFSVLSVVVTSNMDAMDVVVNRTRGSLGPLSCHWQTVDGTATAGLDYEKKSGDLFWASGDVKPKIISVPIIDDVRFEEDEYFTIELKGASADSALRAEESTCRVTIQSDFEVKTAVEKVMEVLNTKNTTKFSWKKKWCNQFKDAMNVERDTDDGEEEFVAGDLEEKGPSNKTYVFHFLTIFWKVLFATVPPVDVCGGWLTFIFSLMYIGILTYIVGDVATMLGCTMGLKEAVTGITIVALGTSVPDTFASRTAAQQGKNADSCVGNVTGSNAVNVFLGLGLPWIIAVGYTMGTTGNPYQVPAGALGFSVALFLALAVTAIIVLIVRRHQGGELGGSKVSQMVTGGCFFLMWFVYVVLCSMQAYGYIGSI